MVSSTGLQSRMEGNDTKILFYKGGLHKILGVPRRWPLNRSPMSLSVFRKSLQRREEAVRRFKENSGEPEPAENEEKEAEEEIQIDDEDSSRKRKRAQQDPAAAGDDGGDVDEAPAKQICLEKLESSAELVGSAPSTDEQKVDTAACPSTDATMETQTQNLEHEKTTQIQTANEERIKVKEELEEKLRTLTTEKHRLVQMLKQILTNEEESKKRGQQTPPVINPASKPPELEEGELDRTPSPQAKQSQLH